MPFSNKIPKPDIVFLSDNGSLRPDTVLALRQLAFTLTHRLGQTVLPVSVLHSNRISSAELDNVPAPIFEEELPQVLSQGLRHICVLPFFFGPSRAITEFLPDRFLQLAKSFPDATLSIAAPLAGSTTLPDPRIAQALLHRIHEIDHEYGTSDAPVVLVDHGSPEPTVTEVRNCIGDQLKHLLPPHRLLAVSSMERRPGPEYAFNDPLLDKVLKQPSFHQGNTVIAQLFLLPGRHAGDEGDIAQICQSAHQKHPSLRCIRTRLLGSHPLIEDILVDRFHEGAFIAR